MYNNINEILTATKGILKAAHIKSNRLEVELLFSSSSNIPVEKCLLYFNDKVSYKTGKKFFSLVERRYLKEPIAYLQEQKEFYSITYYVNKSVLIPRWETELIPEYIIKQRYKLRSILDLCTGSGCIASTLSKYIIPPKEIYGSDIHTATLKVAVKNRKINRFSCLSFLHSNLFKGIRNKAFDIMSCNPPYIPTHDVKHLMEDVRSFEPLSSLNGDKDGLFFYRAIAKEAKNYITSNGQVLLEIGAGQTIDVKAIFEKKGFKLKNILLDLSGIERVLVFRVK